MALDVSVSTRDGEIIQPAQQRPAPPCAIVIFGASGDLTHRKLIPALFDLFQAGLVTKHFAVLGFALHILFSPWLLVIVAIVAWITFRRRRSRQ